MNFVFAEFSLKHAIGIKNHTLLHHVKKDAPEPKAESDSYWYWQKSNRVISDIISGFLWNHNKTSWNKSTFN